jgi:hypothetical protein
MWIKYDINKQTKCEGWRLSILDKTWACSRSVSDIQTRAEGESLYIRYRSDANVLSYLKNDPSYEFIGKVILKINIV